MPFKKSVALYLIVRENNVSSASEGFLDLPTRLRLDREARRRGTLLERLHRREEQDLLDV